MITDFGDVLDLERFIDSVRELFLLVDDQLQDVQRLRCYRKRTEMDFEQAGGSGRVLQENIEAREVS